MKPEYILMTGAPGSKWSSVNNNIYRSEDVNTTDYSDDRLYYHDADTPGHPQLMHIGAYWDPGMEFETDNWDGPFENIEGKTKIIKAHSFAKNLDELKQLGYPIVLVYRDDDACFDWWYKCGGFDITYPNYAPYYQNKMVMKDMIHVQNHFIAKFIVENFKKIVEVSNNIELCDKLGIRAPHGKLHRYNSKDIRVYVYR